MSKEARGQSWSLARRITWGCALTAAVLACSLSVTKFSWLFVVLALVIGASAGALLGGWIAKHFRGLATLIRGMQAPSDAIEFGSDGAPEEIVEIIDALRQKLRDVSGMAQSARLVSSGLGHELRSPLQNLMGEVDLALMRDREPGEYRDVLRGQREELYKLVRMVDNLLALCTAHESRRNSTAEHFDLGVEAGIRLDRVREIACGHDVELRMDRIGSLECDGDREAIMLILRNLLTNAIDSSPEGGVVHVLLNGEKSALEIVVDDGGARVAPEERHRIFDPLYRGHNGGSLSHGLSLALTKQTVEIHGGAIEAMESPLGGMRFSVTLPRGRQ
ncbi:MAG: hypothetical protein CMJ89_09920 [Planctomycetes bacterium]|jgi:two-component system heavy metal sensor histidine kinase CusS|nr:hypothetical protein [Planctomycetota bacterium]